MKIKRVIILPLLLAFTLGCKMPTNEQVEPLQPGIYLAKDGNFTSRLVIDGTTVTYTKDITNPSTAASNLVVFNYTKHKTVSLDFDHIYTRTPDGVRLPGGNLTKRYYGLQLKATPAGAGAFYRLNNPKGSTNFVRNYIILANYSSKGIVDNLVVRPSGILMANSYIETDKYWPPEYVAVLGTPATSVSATNTPATPKNITLYLDGQKADFLYPTTGGLTPGMELPSPLQNKTWIRQKN